MKIREQTTWPPVDDTGRAANLEDSVLRAIGLPGQSGALKLRLQSAQGSLYEVTLTVPHHLTYSAAVAIVLKQGRSLGEIGELDLT